MSVDLRAVQQMLAAWRSNDAIDHLPADQRPRDLAEAYALQDAVLASDTDPVAGYKLAATAKAGQRHIGVDAPLRGLLPASRVLEDGASASMRGNRMRVAEAEFVFVFKAVVHPVPQPRTGAEIMRLVSDLRLGLELPNSRFSAFDSAGAPQLIADNACANLFVLGPVIPAGWRALDLSQITTAVYCDGELRSHGSGADALGGPQIALAWFVNHCSEYNVTIPAGSFITTGVCGVPAPVRPGEKVVAHFAGLGEVAVDLLDDA